MKKVAHSAKNRRESGQGMIYLNESPVFLAQKGRIKEARMVVETMARQPGPALQFLAAPLGGPGGGGSENSWGASFYVGGCL